MESLHLPEGLIWDGKMEPESPSNELFSFSNFTEPWMSEDNFAQDVLNNNKNTEEDLDEFLIDGELLCEFEYDIKKEQWIDGKFGVPLCMDYPSGIISPQPTPLMKVQNPYEIIMELEKFYDEAELTQLTPPQTPPQEAFLSKQIFEMMSNQQTQSDIQNLSDNMILQMSPSSSSAGYSSDSTNRSTSDIAVQIVDEILRTRAKDLPDWINDDDDSMYSTSSSSTVSELNDDDLLPQLSSSLNSAKVKTLRNLSKKQTRPYGRDIQDKKSRKKEQNKNAATRYRQKKKEEMKEILDEERQLLKINEELSKNAGEYKREVKYLKKLIKEFYKNGKK